MASMPILALSTYLLEGHSAKSQGKSMCFIMSCCCVMKHPEVRECE